MGWKVYGGESGEGRRDWRYTQSTTGGDQRRPTSLLDPIDRATRGPTGNTSHPRPHEAYCRLFVMPADPIKRFPDIYKGTQSSRSSSHVARLKPVRAAEGEFIRGRQTRKRRRRRLTSPLRSREPCLWEAMSFLSKKKWSLSSQ